MKGKKGQRKDRKKSSVPFPNTAHKDPRRFQPSHEAIDKNLQIICLNIDYRATKLLLIVCIPVLSPKGNRKERYRK